LINKKSKKGNRVVGTPDYIPPEVINGDSINNKSIDFWSLGVMIYEMVTGGCPFNDETIEQIFDKITNKNI
jgi:serine/threonine protein kinase